jgi:hypothetical protein
MNISVLPFYSILEDCVDGPMMLVWPKHVDVSKQEIVITYFETKKCTHQNTTKQTTKHISY